MKKAILIMLAALLLVSSFTACGSKKANYDDDGYSRVLYDDSDAENSKEDEDEDPKEDEQSESSVESQTDTDSAEDKEEKIESRSKNSDSDKGNTTTVTAKKAVSSSASSKAANSSSSKSTTIKSTTSKASAAVSSKATSAAESSSSVSSENYTDSSYDSDTDTNTDTEWFDSENDSTDSETEDTDSEIEKGSFEYSDMAFPVNGSSIQVGQDFKTADDLLGGPNNKVGNVYYYNECEITTNGNEDNEIITNITINNYGYYISKGIGIGSTTEDLLRAFGDAEFGYTYTLGDRILNFTVLEDTVTGISFS